MLFPELVDSSVALTNARGCFSHSLAEFALFGMKYFALDMPRHVRNKTAARWEPFDVQELRGQTLGIVGFGDIGRSCARLARASGMRIAAARRDWSGRTAPCGEEPDPGLRFESVPDGLTALAEASDFVVMSTPWTPETNAMIGADFFSAMGPDGVFVNVGRGACVDEQSLVDALRSRIIKGAALDVFAEEPLPSSSALWGLENVVITPHCADRTEHFQRDAVRQFIENVERFQSGDPLNNPVDKRLGY
jgi:phosphoglycerate dehydrogenase-like enzyme